MGKPSAERISTAARSVAAEVRAEMARQQRQQVELAASLGLSQAAVSRRLAGVTPWSVDELLAAAAFLDVPIESLIGRGVA